MTKALYSKQCTDNALIVFVQLAVAQKSQPWSHVCHAKVLFGFHRQNSSTVCMCCMELYRNELQARLHSVTLHSSLLWSQYSQRFCCVWLDASHHASTLARIPPADLAPGASPQLSLVLGIPFNHKGQIRKKYRARRNRDRETLIIDNCYACEFAIIWCQQISDGHHVVSIHQSDPAQRRPIPPPEHC